MHDFFDRPPASEAVKEKSKDELLKELETGGSGRPARERLHDALVALLIDKKIITEDELVRKAKEL